MNKKIFVSVLMAIILFVIASYFLDQQLQSTKPHSSLPTSTIAQPGPPPTYGSVDIFGERKSFEELISMVREATGLELFFEDQLNKARNSKYYVYLEEEKIGIVQGQDIALLSSSPNRKLFAFRNRGQGGCCASSYEILVIDTAKRNLTRISTPRKEHDFLGEGSGLGREVFPVIDSYDWENNESLRVLFYFAGAGSDFDNKT